MLPFAFTALIAIMSIPHSVKGDPQFSEIYNQTFETQQELFVCHHNDDKYLKENECSYEDNLAKLKKGTRLQVTDIIKKNKPFVGTFITVRVNIVDPFFKSINATDLLTLRSWELSYGKASAQFDPEFLKNIEINTLQTAARYGDLEAVKELVSKGFDPNLQDFNGKTALHYAQRLDIVQYLLDHKANEVVDNLKRTLLHYAAKDGRSDIVELLIKNGANIDLQDSDENTPLLLAIRGNHFDLVAFLLESGADPRIKGQYQDTVLLEAAHAGRLDIVELALKFGADPLVISGHNMSGILFAARNGDLAMAKLFIELGADVNSTNSIDDSALHFAAGNLPMLRLLMENGADINHADGRGITVLHKAIYYSYNNLNIIKYLYENGADINQPDNDGETPLFVAIAGRRPEVVKWLLEHGASVDIKDKRGWTPLQYAENFELSDTIELLRSQTSGLYHKSKTSCNFEKFQTEMKDESN